jgi:uncharacterized membrane protein
MPKRRRESQGAREERSHRVPFKGVALTEFSEREESTVQHQHTEHVAVPPDAVYAAISDVNNLPRFVPQITAVRPSDGDHVEVDARYEGREQHGEASFSADDSEHRIEWSAPSGYQGWMKVDPDGEGSRLTLFLETRHGSEREHDVAATLDAIRMLVESEV